MAGPGARDVDLASVARFGVAPGTRADLESMRPTLLGERYVVSTGHPLTTRVAVSVLEAGGNAIDAGVAAGLAANVVQPDACTLGGIAPTVVRLGGSDEVWSIDGVGAWGREASIDAYVSRYGHHMSRGAATAIVPGAIGAWLTALERFGTWTFSEAAACAIAFAKDGFFVDHRLQRALAGMMAGLPREQQWQTTLETFRPGGHELRVGDRLVQPSLGALFEELAGAEVKRGDRAQGIDQVRSCFYQGDIASRIVRAVTDQGGWLTPTDLAEHRTEVTAAPSVAAGTWRVHAPSTWSQGPALLQALGILRGVDLGTDPTAARWIHGVAESCKLAFSERERVYGDPRCTAVDLAAILSEDHLGSLRGRLGRDALPNLPTMPFAPGTTCICVVDSSGNAFSATASDTIGGAPLIPGLGILCSPRGKQSRLSPDHPNALAPGKRPCVTPAPAVALRAGEDPASQVLAFACPGGDAIVQAMAQVFLLFERSTLTPQEAVEVPRFATFSYPVAFHPHAEARGVLYVENRVAADVLADLQARGHDVRPWAAWEFDAGSVGVAMDLFPPADGHRVLAAASDPRRTAYAMSR